MHQSLHSILVKSILRNARKAILSVYLYIPFWLNLYVWRKLLCTYANYLYIPFWLNLYFSTSACSCIVCFLYIPFWLNLYKIVFECDSGMLLLYIPFWLNLYGVYTTAHARHELTLHSILVKSIQRAMVAECR